jgi:hypothetical protein
MYAEERGLCDDAIVLKQEAHESIIARHGGGWAAGMAGAPNETVLRRRSPQSPPKRRRLQQKSKLQTVRLFQDLGVSSGPVDHHNDRSSCHAVPVG